eukprot:Skav225808  [mRNA]  locus=scaffold5154:241608:244146:- [translate_table: standard]
MLMFPDGRMTYSGARAATPGSAAKCIFFASGMGCWKGRHCPFRHVVNQGEASGPRPKKEIRDKVKEEMRRCFDEKDPDVIYQRLQEASQQSRYAHTLIVGYLDKLTAVEQMDHQGGLVFSL